MLRIRRHALPCTSLASMLEWGLGMLECTCGESHPHPHHTLVFPHETAWSHTFTFHTHITCSIYNSASFHEINSHEIKTISQKINSMKSILNFHKINSHGINSYEVNSHGHTLHTNIYINIFFSLSLTQSWHVLSDIRPSEVVSIRRL